MNATIEAVEPRFLPGRSRHSSADRAPVKRETAEGARVATHLRGPRRAAYSTAQPEQNDAP